MSGEKCQLISNMTEFDTRRPANSEFFSALQIKKQTLKNVIQSKKNVKN